MQLTNMIICLGVAALTQTMPLSPTAISYGNKEENSTRSGF
jgi:hypothetical protein